MKRVASTTSLLFTKPNACKFAVARKLLAVLLGFVRPIHSAPPQRCCASLPRERPRMKVPTIACSVVVVELLSPKRSTVSSAAV